MSDERVCTLDGHCTDYRAFPDEARNGPASVQMRFLAWQHGDNPEHRSRVYDMHDPIEVAEWVRWFDSVHARMQSAQLAAQSDR